MHQREYVLTRSISTGISPSAVKHGVRRPHRAAVLCLFAPRHLRDTLLIGPQIFFANSCISSIKRLHRSMTLLLRRLIQRVSFCNSNTAGKFEIDDGAKGWHAGGPWPAAEPVESICEEMLCKRRDRQHAQHRVKALPDHVPNDPLCGARSRR
jgi:hypothetical protein